MIASLHSAIGRPRKLLLLLLVFVGLIKISTFLWVYQQNPARIFSPDSWTYIHSALALQHTGKFVIDPEHPETPQLQRTPGYPAFIAGIFSLWGESYLALIIIQIVISLGTLFLTFCLAAHLWNARVAWLAALLLALDIPSFVMSQKVLTETLFTFVLLLALLAGVSSLSASRLRLLMVLGHSACLALTALVRPVAYYAILASLGGYALIGIWWKKWAWKQIFVGLLFLLAPWLLLAGGWQVRNRMQAGTWEFSAIQNVNLLFYRGADILARRDGLTFEDAQRRLGYQNYRQQYPETADWSEAQLSRRWKAEALQLIRQYPGLFVTGQMEGLLKLLIEPGEYTLLHYLGFPLERTGPLRDLLTLPFSAYLQKWGRERSGHFLLFVYAESYLLLLYIGMLSAFGYFFIQREFDPVHLFLLLILAYFIGVSSGPEAYSRFRIPLMPLFSMFGAYGLGRLAAGVRRGVS